MRLLVFTGGCLGTLLRWAAGATPPAHFPWTTLGVNLAGTTVLGFLVGRRETGRLDSRWIPFAGVGVMGSLTTFGTMSVQILDLVAAGKALVAVAYAFVGLVAGAGLGLAAVRVGEEWP